MSLTSTSEQQHLSITLVTVTYGKRWHLLEQAVRSVVDQNISRVIIVNNGSPDPITELCQKNFGDIAEVIELGVNTGSANGFKIGIETALLKRANFIFLLDDDNLLGPQVIQTLFDAHKKLEVETGASKIAVAALRPDHQSAIVERIPYQYSIPHTNSFLGFHVSHIPFKIMQRILGSNRGHVGRPLEDFIKIDTAPYSGLLLPSSLIESIGLPNINFVLYADDTDFSFRITQQGGSIYLVTTAVISDIEASCNIKASLQSSFDILLTGQGDLRAYYAMRNQTYFEMYRRPHNSTVRKLNKWLYLSFLWVRSRVLNKRERYRLIRKAIRDGEECRLGLHPDFLLYTEALE